MVERRDDPYRRDADNRRRRRRWAKVGITVLVGLSTGLMTTQGEASLAVVLWAIGGGLLAGAALAWYLL